MGTNMTSATLTHAMIARSANLSDEAMALLRPDRPARDYVGVLLRNRMHTDAIAFLAHILPRREAVWWAWSCARDVIGEKAPPPIEASLEATRRWILEPTDLHRRAANDAAEAIDYDGPAGMAGLAVFLCGDTLGPADAPAAPPDPHASGHMIAGAVTIAAAEGDEDGMRGRYEAFIARGIERADKTNTWPVPHASRAEGRD
jgi:Family of unknown function (DUF6931)